MSFKDFTIGNFLDETFSSAPIPGGGGVSALCASLAASLSGMVSNLTKNKKKYRQYQLDIERMLERANVLKKECAELIDADAKAFLPLSKAYSLPNATEEEKKNKNEALSIASMEAIIPPLKLMELCVEGLSIDKELLDKGSVLVQSDVGVSALLFKSAAESGYLNILINLKLIDDDEKKKSIMETANKLLKDSMIGHEIYEEVLRKLQN